MKAVLISIHPRWCELIAAGKKTIEVRKTKPKLETPFKVYIYCTKDKHGWFDFGKKQRLDGTVIGEFVCVAVLPMSVKYSNPNHHVANREFPLTCLTGKQIMDYLGNGKDGFGWHISDLKIYEKPKKLGEFHFSPERYCEKGLCGGCPFDESPDVNGEYMYGCDWERPLQTPPQSWCYVEAITNG